MSIPTKLTRAEVLPMITAAFLAAIREYRAGYSGIGVYLSSKGTIETGSNAQDDFGAMILDGDAYDIAPAADLDDDQVEGIAAAQLQSDAAEVYYSYATAYDEYFLADVPSDAAVSAATADWNNA